jgi:hypothetical protein
MTRAWLSPEIYIQYWFGGDELSELHLMETGCWYGYIFCMKRFYALTITDMVTMQYIQLIFTQVNVIGIFSSEFYAQNRFLHCVIIIW